MNQTIQLPRLLQIHRFHLEHQTVPAGQLDPVVPGYLGIPVILADPAGLTDL